MCYSFFSTWDKSQIWNNFVDYSDDKYDSNPSRPQTSRSPYAISHRWSNECWVCGEGREGGSQHPFSIFSLTQCPRSPFLYRGLARVVNGGRRLLERNSVSKCQAFKGANLWTNSIIISHLTLYREAQNGTRQEQAEQLSNSLQKGMSRNLEHKI